MTPSPSHSIAYVSCADSREIQVLELNSITGDVQAIQKVPTGGMVMPLAVSPDRSHLYAALRSAPYSVLSFAIAPQRGLLSLVGNTPLPDSVPYIATDRTGTHLLAASYGGHHVVVCRIGADGVVEAPHEQVQTEPNAHAIVPDPSNRFVFVPCLGAHAVMQFRFDETDGTLLPNTPATVPMKKGAGPRHFVFHPGGRHAYLLGELDASVTAFDFDDASGTLAPIQTVSAMPAGFPETPWAADLHLTPDGRFLYASERRSSTLAIFAVGSDGRLEPAGNCPTEREPRGFAIDPTGRHLLAVGQASHSLTSYAIDRETGWLTETRRFAMGRNPNWVEIVALR